MLNGGPHVHGGLGVLHGDGGVHAGLGVHGGGDRGGRSVGGADGREQPMGLADLVAGVPVTVLPNLNIPPREYSSRFRARHNSVTIAKFLRHFERPVTRICFDLQNFLF